MAKRLMNLWPQLVLAVLENGGAKYLIFLLFVALLFSA